MLLLLTDFSLVVVVVVALAQLLLYMVRIMAWYLFIYCTNRFNRIAKKGRLLATHFLSESLCTRFIILFQKPWIFEYNGKQTVQHIKRYKASAVRPPFIIIVYIFDAFLVYALILSLFFLAVVTWFVVFLFVSILLHLIGLTHILWINQNVLADNRPKDFIQI